MPRPWILSKTLATVAITLVLVAVCIGAEPTSRPATSKPAPASQPVLGERINLAGGIIYLFAPPLPWQRSAGETDIAVAFTSPAGNAIIQVQLLPPDASVEPGIVGQVAQGIIKQLKEMRAKAKVEMIQPPRVEQDQRFAIRIHEKLKVGQDVADQLHLYRGVGPRVVMAVIGVTSNDPFTVSTVQKLGEAVALSAKLDRAVFLKSRK